MAEEDLKDLQRHSAIQDARISNLETKFEMFMQSIKDSNDKRYADLQDFKNEMRGRDDRRAEEIAEIRNDIKEIYKATDSKFEKLSSQVQSIVTAAVVGVGALVVGVISFVVSNVKF